MAKDEDFWKDVSDEELLHMLGSRLKQGRIKEISDEELLEEVRVRFKQARVMAETAETAIGLLRRKNKDADLLIKKIIDFDDLSERAKNALRNATILPGLVTFDDVRRQSRKRLMRRQNLGPKIADEIKQWVNKYGYELAQ